MPQNGMAAVATPHIAGESWNRLHRSPAYDVLMRVLFVAWAFLGAMVTLITLIHYIRSDAAAASALAYAANIAMRLATFCFFVLMAASVMARVRPAARAQGLEPRLSALLGSFIVYGLCLLPRRELTPAAALLSTVLVLAGTAGAVFVLSQLGRSFSIMAEARQLVTSGVYRFVRHPLYLAEELAMLGVVMQFLSYWAALLLVVQVAFQLRRISNEERVLRATFPEYAAYCRSTARLIPGFY